MNQKVTVYQTLENRDNADQVENEGPFICNWSNSWLGTGYYFWEAFIKNAHWWGDAHVGGNYFICEASCYIDSNSCFDLVGNTNHMLIFEEAIKQMREQELVKETTTVSRIIHYIREKIKTMNVEASRAVGFYSISEYKYPEHIFKMLFEPDKKYYIDYKPPIQLCLYSKKSLNLSGYKVIYPPDYSFDYVV